MTVTYTAQVATSSVGCFLRLLVRWRGSIYKLMWKEFLVFGVAYYTLNLVYRFALDENQKRVFERVSRYCEAYNNLIPLAFVLGFYVSIVITRWWDQFMLIPWPDRMAMFVTANVHGHDERGRLMRRTIMRYLCLAYVITMSSISPVVKKRFPRFQHMTETGFMLPSEQKIMEDIQTQHNKYFVPLAWATSLVTRSRKENRIRDDFAVKTLIDEINAFRGMLGGLFNYDWISIPLVYTQVVTLAVYTFFLSCLMGRQFVEKGGLVDDMYVPIFTFLQFFFYMGWLKVAESLVNPFGEDDDDFDINAVIDRNLQVSYLVVDEMHAEHPELIRDQYWDEVDFEPAYTAASAQSKIPEPYLGSAFSISLLPHEEEFVAMDAIQEDGEYDPENNDTTTKPSNIPNIVKATFTGKNSSFGKAVGKGSPSHLPFHNRMRRSTSRLSKGSIKGRVQRQGSDVSQVTGGTSPTDIRDGDDIFAMSDLLSEHQQSTVDMSADPHGHHPHDEDDVVTIIHHRRKSFLDAARKAQKQGKPKPMHDDDLIGRSYAPARSLGAGFTLDHSVPLGDGMAEYRRQRQESPTQDPLTRGHSDSTVRESGSESDLVPIPEDSARDSDLPLSKPDSPKAFSSYSKGKGAQAFKPRKEEASSSKAETARLIPQDTLDAAQDLKLKKENEKIDNLPRSVSIAGDDVSKDLKLAQEPLDPRTRTNSEGPSMGMEKRPL